jgi:hypothetical protein
MTPRMAIQCRQLAITDLIDLGGQRWGAERTHDRHFGGTRRTDHGGLSGAFRFLAASLRRRKPKSSMK